MVDFLTKEKQTKKKKSKSENKKNQLEITTLRFFIWISQPATISGKVFLWMAKSKFHLLRRIWKQMDTIAVKTPVPAQTKAAHAEFRIQALYYNIAANAI